ncbi:hypothetical protein OROGR_004195 [Orobanche gracilis]
MGSEGPKPAVIIHVTGFKKFHGVSENPTETVVNNLQNYMNKRGLPKGLNLGSCTILETAGQGATGSLYQTLQSAVINDTTPSHAATVIWRGTLHMRVGHGQSRTSSLMRKQYLYAKSGGNMITFMVHFGVNSGATRFVIEQQAVNEATFRCPDELGWKPQKVPIVPADGAISRTREFVFGDTFVVVVIMIHGHISITGSYVGTSLPVEDITKSLAKMGYEVMTSDDAGRFVCNYVYYHSLRFAEVNRIKSLFVHVPLFCTIDEETQMQFAASLLEVLASLY